MIFSASASVFDAFFGFLGGVSCVIRAGGSVTWWSGLTVEFNTKSKFYLYTSTIKVSVYVRLTVFLKHPEGLHVHDGPRMESDQVNCNRNVIHLSLHQAFVVAFANTWTTRYRMYPLDLVLSYKGRDIKAIKLYI